MLLFLILKAENVDPSGDVSVENLALWMSKTGNKNVSYSDIVEHHGDFSFNDIENLFEEASNPGVEVPYYISKYFWSVVATERPRQATLVGVESLLSSSDPERVMIAASLLNNIDYSHGGYSINNIFHEIIDGLPEGEYDRLLIYLNQNEPAETLKLLIKKNGPILSRNADLEIIAEGELFLANVREGVGILRSQEERIELLAFFEKLTEHDSWIFDFFVAGIIKSGRMRNVFPSITDKIQSREKELPKEMLKKGIISFSKMPSVENDFSELRSSFVDDEKIHIKRRGEKRAAQEIENFPSTGNPNNGRKKIWVIPIFFVILIILGSVFFLRKGLI